MASKVKKVLSVHPKDLLKSVVSGIDEIGKIDVYNFLSFWYFLIFESHMENQ